MNAIKVKTDPKSTKYPIAHQDTAGIADKLTEVPVAPIKAKIKILEINICNPKPKYGLKLVAFFLVYKVPKAQVKVAIIEIKIPKRKSEIRKCKTQGKGKRKSNSS